MTESNIFDMWANGYDKQVQLSDNNNEYPFAGYKEVMNTIYSAVMKKSPTTVLDVGIGTGTLALKLYEGGNAITGVDFSREMLEIAKAKMPGANLYQFDFAHGLPSQLAQEKYDFIISTYALHHLTDSAKVAFIKSLLNHLNSDGSIFIGDVGFPTARELNKCKEQHSPDDWDDDEYYFVFPEIAQKLKDSCTVSHTQLSHCGGVLEIRKKT